MKCSVCGKEMVNTIGDDKPFIQQGWQCPKCGAILAPHQDYCPFCKGGGTTGTVLKSKSKRKSMCWKNSQQGCKSIFGNRIYPKLCLIK